MKLSCSVIIADSITMATFDSARLLCAPDGIPHSIKIQTRRLLTEFWQCCPGNFRNLLAWQQEFLSKDISLEQWKVENNSRFVSWGVSTYIIVLICIDIYVFACANFLFLLHYFRDKVFVKPEKDHLKTGPRGGEGALFLPRSLHWKKPKLGTDPAYYLNIIFNNMLII